MKTVTVLSLLSSAALAATLSACNPAGEKASADGSVASARAGSLEGPTRGDGSRMGDTGAMTSMAGMAGMAGMTSAGAVDSMETRLRTMDMMSAAQIKAALPAHTRAAGNMLSRMSADVQRMHMSPNTGWSATTDSIRQELSHMAGLTGAQMKAAMPAYHARMTRLMDMHRQMMAQTKR